MMKSFRLIPATLLACAFAANAMDELPTDSMDVGRVYRLEVLQVTDIEPYQQALDGFLATLERHGLQQGKNLIMHRAKIDFDIEKAGFWSKLGVVYRVRQEAQRMAAAKPDLVLTLGTPATRYARPILEEARVPMTFTAVANPLDAGCPSLKDCGPNVTGSTLYMDMAESLKTVQRIFPAMQRIGIVHTDDENGVAHVDAVRARAADLKISVSSQEVDKRDNIVPALKSLYRDGSGVQLFAVPLDTYYGLRNYEPATDLSDYTTENQIPVVSLALVRVPGAVLYVGADFREVGGLAGTQAIKILAKRIKPDVLPVLRQAQPTVLFDPARARALRIALPEDALEKKASRDGYVQLGFKPD
jgi:putative tryptophan/tyrosine transport system substrate-binding protein